MVQVHSDPPILRDTALCSSSFSKLNVLTTSLVSLELASPNLFKPWLTRFGHVIYSQLHVNGAIAQLGERLPCTQEVCGSIPHSSTIYSIVKNLGSTTLL